MKGEIEKTLETMDNVLKARVILSVPQISPNPFSEPKELTGASVLLKIKKGTYVSKDTVKGILIGAVSSIDKEKISIEIVESSAQTTKSSGHLINIGPFLLSESSAKTFYAVLISILVIISVAVSMLFFFFIRKKSFLPEAKESEGY